MSDLDNPMGSFTRVCMDANRGLLIEDVLLSVAADLTRAFEALGYPALGVVLGDDVPLAETQAALLGVARAVVARYDEYFAKTERKIRATDPPSGGSAPSTCAGRRQGGSR